MTISQQISPSSLRAYKLSKYVNGQPGKLLLEAKKARRVTSQFMSRKGAREAAKQAKALKSSVKESGKLWDKLLSKIPGRNKEVKAAKAGGGLASLAVLAGLTLVIAAKTITDIQIQNIGIDNELKNNSEFQKAFDRYQRNVLDIRALNKKIDAQNKILQRNNKDLDNISKNFFNVKTQAEQAAKKGNDALYEVRQGRKIVEEKIAQQASDIATIKYQISKTLSGINENFQKSVSTTITNLQKSLQQANGEVQKVNNQISIQSKIITELQSGVRTVQTTVTNIPKTIDTKIEDLKQFTIKLINGKTQPVELEQKAIRQDLTQIKSNGITKQEIEGVNATLRKTYEQSFEYKAQQWQQEIQKQNEKVSVTVSSNYTTTTSKLGEIEKQNTQLKTDLDKLNTRIGEQEKVNKDALPKLDSILTMLPLIPARAAGLINPNIPKPSDIERATGTAICRSLNGGCAGKSLDDAINNVNNHNNQNTGSLLDKLNAGAQIPELALLGVINNKLGDQLPGGLSGKLTRFTQWLQLDRAINLLTFAATIHNAVMLSNDVGQTLLGALNNVLQLIGLKDDNGQPFDIGAIISSSIENFIKSIVGADNYVTLKASWEKANRIYQATTNVLNNLMNVNAVITNALEVIGGYTGRIGNALRIWGVVGEKAYSWMNPQPSFDNKWITKLQQLQEGANTVAMVAQIPVDVASSVSEFNNSTTDLIKAIKQEPDTKDGIDPGEAAKVKTEREAAKAASFTVGFDISDLFDADD
ncbi:hypothetical protein [Nostoc sp. FACHB-110]|uniref:hypothetical protein n=1 Tax=Nostoc sp. FACHB-110 TaxID=2692834 RepID=UPI001683554E|nr:hypothetical protein [Nostoc sp. FACHB-110]MBD2438256.1 hypothetical protein [Nostoc sp. FACHB-110]